MKSSVENKIGIIDIFAGPGGLGEGFASFSDQSNKLKYKMCLSIEKDEVAHKTLELRSFYRQFDKKSIPNEYYMHLRGEISREDLFEKFSKEAKKAQKEAWQAELGHPDYPSDEVDKRIIDALKGLDTWVLTGGPPCQAYSLVGRSRNKGIKGYVPEDDDRHFLYKEYLRVLARHWPAVFIMENVKGILSSQINGNSMFDRIIDDLSKPLNSFSKYETEKNKSYEGYTIFSLVKQAKGEFSLSKPPHYNRKEYIIHSEKYGIPQSRHRVILLGIRNDLLTMHPDILTAEKKISVYKALSGLPRLRSGLSKAKDSKESWGNILSKAQNSPWMEAVKAKSEKVHKLMISTLSSLKLPLKDRGMNFIKCKANVHESLKEWILDPRINGVCNHSTRGHMTEDLYRYLYASCYSKVHGISPKLSDYPDELLPNHKNAKKGHFTDRFRVQISGRPSTTITSHISKDGHYYIHPDPGQVRSLTVREAARLQTFPDNYFFTGNRTQQYVQVGNAVPPLLAHKIAKIVYKVLKDMA